LLRSDPPMPLCPENVSWHERFEEAMQAIGLAAWQAGADRLASLATDFPEEASIWRNLATIRGWLGDNDGAIAALHKYSALRAAQPDGFDDAVEAEAEAMFLSPDPLGDRIDILNLTFTVKDVERAQEAFLSAPRFRPVPFDPARFIDSQTPPPKGAFMIIDKPLPESATGLTMDSIPQLLAQALLFGRQTDCEARFQVTGVTADEVAVVRQLIVETAGDAIDPQPKEEVVGAWSSTQKVMRAAWQPPRDITPEELRPLLDEYQRKAMLQQWPALKLGALDGRSAREAAGDPNYRIRLAAAMLVLDFWSDRLPVPFDLNELRKELGLPIPAPIDAKEQPVQDIPITRLDRLKLDDLSDQDLVLAFYRAGAFAIRSVLRKSAELIVARPSLAESEDRLHAYATLIRTEQDLSKALEYLAQARAWSDAHKESNASWDLMELSLRFAARDVREAMRLIEHLQKNHVEEPGVAESLTRMLMEVGLIRPDGTPAAMPRGAQAAPMAEAEPTSGGLWTPDGEGGQSAGGGGKLWTPD
jgi:hypothetical protein